MTAFEQDPLLGRVLDGKLRLDARLGAGAAGAVYRAHHLALDRPVAIKVLHQTHSTDLQLIRRFKAEARAASRLDHPHSVRILDFGEDGPDHLLYIAMEFIDGESLQGLLDREPALPSWRIASIMAQVASALAHAHEEGIVHRDIKPGNIMLQRRVGEEGVEQDWVKVCDFGLAKILDVNPDDLSSGPLTKQGTIFGTPTYMAPEQANGDPADGRADQYACGVIVFRMACGGPPFTADSATGLLMKHILEPPPPVLSRAPNLDPRLGPLVDRMLAKAPDDRFPSMRDVLAVLREVAADAPAGAAPLVRGPSVMASPRAQTPAPPAPPASASSSLELSDTRISGGIGAQEVALASVPPAPPPRTNILAAVMGSVALLAVGGLGTYVLLQPKPPAVTAPAQPAEVPAAEAPKPAPAVPAEPPVVAEAPEEPAPEEPLKPPPPSRVTPKPKPTSTKPAPKPTPAAPPPSAPKVPDPEPPPSTPPPPATTPPVSVPPPAETPPPVMVEPKPPVALPGKVTPSLGTPTLKPRLQPRLGTPLGADFQWSCKVGDVEVGGGLSARRTQEAIERVMDPLSSCLKDRVAEVGVQTAGKIVVKGRIAIRGTLAVLGAQGGPKGAAKCVSAALTGARMPQPDTGEADLELVIVYSASPKT